MAEPDFLRASVKIKRLLLDQFTGGIGRGDDLGANFRRLRQADQKQTSLTKQALRSTLEALERFFAAGVAGVAGTLPPFAHSVAESLQHDKQHASSGQWAKSGVARRPVSLNSPNRCASLSAEQRTPRPLQIQAASTIGAPIHHSPKEHSSLSAVLVPFAQRNFHSIFRPGSPL